MKSFFGLILKLLICNSLIVPASSLERKMQNYDFFFHLPIDLSREEGRRTNLKLMIPSKFRCLQQDKISNNSNLPENLEFIPQNDDEYNWSRIITSTAYVGKSIKAKDLIFHMKSMFLQNSVDLRILEESTSQIDSIETAILSIIYTHKGRREFVRIKAFSGLFDCASVQYAIAIDKDVTEDNVLEEIKSWMEDTSNLELIKF